MCRYLHLLNLYYLFECVIPIIQDYGAALKGNDPSLFLTCFDKLLLVFLMCNDPAGAIYQKTLFLYRQLLNYWMEQGLPVMLLVKHCHTAFSEESGELALGKLAQNIPANEANDLTGCQAVWKLLRLYSRKSTESLQSKLTKSRFLGTHLSVIILCRYS